MNPLIQRETTILALLIGLALGCFALPPGAQAVVPPPDGGYFGANTAEGQDALFHLTIGSSNTAIGFHALYFNTTGSKNTAVGDEALALNTSGFDNTAIGLGALQNNIGGSSNTAMGRNALQGNTNGQANVANGWAALGSNRTGNFNTAVGWDALGSNTTGDGNTALGYGALFTNITGSNNTALGAFAGKGVTTANNVVCIGNGVLGGDVSNSTWVGNVYGVTTQSGTTAPVVVSDGGQLGTVASSERFKKDIANMEKTSEAILALRPVTFHYKTDSKSTPQFGLIAEEVAKVNSALVLPDKEGKPYTVRYDAVNAMLLNEFLKEHQKVEELETALRAVNERLAEQDAKIQKVSAKIELNERAPRTLVSNH
jgi:hypothetical protein